MSPAEWQGDDYQAQFDMLAASGQDVHGDRQPWTDGGDYAVSVRRRQW